VYRLYAIVAESDLRDAGTKLAAMPGTTTEPARLSDSSGDDFGGSTEDASAKRLTKLVGRDGIEPPTPGFSVRDGLGS